MTIRTRLTASVGLIVAAAIFASAYGAHYNTSRRLQAETDRFLVARSTRAVRVAGGPQSRLPVVPPVIVGITGEGFLGLDSVTQVLRPDGTIVSRVNSQPPLPVDERDIAIASGPIARDVDGEAGVRIRSATVDGVRYRVLTTPLPGGGAVQIGRSQTESDSVLAFLRVRLILGAIVGAALAAAAAWLLGRRIARPIKQLTEASEHIASTQDLAVPIEVRGRDEVARLAASFNTMLVALDTSREQQRRLVTDASHELRTPLTAVRTNVDFLLRSGDSLDAEQRQLLAETTLELTELSNLVVELVELATAVRSEEPVGPVHLGEVAEEVAQRFRRRTGRTITVVSEAGPAVDARRSMIERAVSNLVDNALKFSPGGEPVVLEVTAAGRIDVADRGPGIATDDLPIVFDRFYRAAASRGLPGSGLGLAIVKQIVEVHGGAVWMLRRPGGGTIARVELPAARRDSTAAAETVRPPAAHP